jgi:hypothetical protein
MRGFSVAVLCVLFIVFCVVLFMMCCEVAVNMMVSFENLTTSIFEGYNVTGDARRLYHDVVLVPLKNFVNLMFLLMFLALFICIVVVLIEVMH